MLYVILICLFLLIAIPLVRNLLKNVEQSGRGSDTSNFPTTARSTPHLLPNVTENH